MHACPKSACSNGTNGFRVNCPACEVELGSGQSRAACTSTSRERAASAAPADRLFRLRGSRREKSAARETRHPGHRSRERHVVVSTPESRGLPGWRQGCPAQESGHVMPLPPIVPLPLSRSHCADDTAEELVGCRDYQGIVRPSNVPQLAGRRPQLPGLKPIQPGATISTKLLRWRFCSSPPQPRRRLTHHNDRLRAGRSSRAVWFRHHTSSGIETLAAKTGPFLLSSFI